MNQGEPASADYLLDAAQDALARGEWARAEFLARQRIDECATDAYAWSVLGSARALGSAPADAEAAYRRSMELDPELPDPHCGIADLCLQRGDTQAGLALFAQTLRRWPAHAPAALMLGHALRSRGDADAAGAAFMRGARAWPEFREAIELVLDCAATLLERNHPPVASPGPDDDAATSLISFVVCSITPEKLARAHASLTRALDGADWELVHVPDARSLCEGYNRGLARARGDTIVFCHDDIEVLVDALHRRLARALRAFDVVGVAGCTRLTGPSWTWSGAPHGHGWIAHALPDGRFSARAYSMAGPYVHGIEALDGVFIACRRAVAEALRFDDATFDHFHLYDADFSYRAHRAGYRVGVSTELRLLHYSGGRDTGGHWRVQADRFLTKFGMPMPGPTAPLAGADVIVPDTHAATRLFTWLDHWQSLAPAS